MRRALIDEAVAQIGLERAFAGRLAGDFAFLRRPVFRVLQQVIVVFRAHQPRSGEGERHARGVDGDPAPTPLFGHIGRRAGAAGRVEYEVAWVGGHEDATFDDLRASFNYIFFVCRGPHIGPDIVLCLSNKVIKKSNVTKAGSRRSDSISLNQSSEPLRVSAPVAVRRRKVIATLKIDRECHIPTITARCRDDLLKWSAINNEISPPIEIRGPDCSACQRL
jgi:hypothetical protein